MQFISILSTLILCVLILMNFQDTVAINLLSEKFAAILHLTSYKINFNLSIYTLAMFILGEIAAVFFFAPLYISLKEKFNAYKRELEKDSLSNTTNEAKIQVLENKITVLEKALDDALKRNN